MLYDRVLQIPKFPSLPSIKMAGLMELLEAEVLEFQEMYI
jgi:hypothetical protein